MFRHTGLSPSVPQLNMQFIEKNSFNVRSAIYHLKKDGAGLDFLLFPMIHVGSQQFYDEVGRRLMACDSILAEGVGSKRASLLTLSYRIVKRIKRMDLVTQKDGLKLSGMRDRIVNADMSGRAFDERWSTLPLLLRVQLFLLIPAYVIYLVLVTQAFRRSSAIAQRSSGPFPRPITYITTRCLAEYDVITINQRHGDRFQFVLPQLASVERVLHSISFLK
jgi:hypothetical protein